MTRTYNCFLTADIVLVVGNEVLLVRRGNEPFRGRWAFPGGFVEADEPVIKGAERELMEETGVTGIALQQLGAYGDPGRDPRGRTLSVVYWARLSEKPETSAGDDAAECGWFPLEDLPPMAFDHAKIAEDVRGHLQGLSQ
jgi:8-oxo-dGTP diphosphatase